MPFQRDAAKSIRDNIVEFVRSQLDTYMRKGLTFTTAYQGDTWTVQSEFDTVVRYDLGKPEAIKGRDCSVLDMGETKQREIGGEKCFLNIAVEWNYRPDFGDELDQRSFLNQQLADVQAVVMMDPSCGGIAYDIQEINNDLETAGRNDKVTTGTVLWRVTYMHKVGNPNKLRGE